MGAHRKNRKIKGKKGTNIKKSSPQGRWKVLPALRTFLDLGTTCRADDMRGWTHEDWWLDSFQADWAHEVHFHCLQALGEDYVGFAAAQSYIEEY